MSKINLFVEKNVKDTYDLFYKMNLCKIRTVEDFVGCKEREISNIHNSIEYHTFDENGVVYIRDDSDRDIEFNYCENCKKYYITERFWNEEETEIIDYEDILISGSYIVALKRYLKVINISSL